MNFIIWLFLTGCITKNYGLQFPATVDSVNGRWVTVEIFNDKGESVLVDTPVSYFSFMPKEGEQWYYKFVDCSRCEDIPIRTTCKIVSKEELK